MVIEVKKPKDIKAIKDKADQQIKYLYEKATLTPEEVYLVTKKFFKELLDITYEFSHEELLDELSKTYVDIELKKYIQTFIETIGKIEYNSQVSFTLQELKTFLEQLQQIIDKLVVEETKQNSKGFTLFGNEQEKSLGELIEQIKLQPTLAKGKEIYQKALEKYNSLSEKEQTFYFERLQEAFKHLKAVAEKNR